MSKKNVRQSANRIVRENITGTVRENFNPTVNRTVKVNLSNKIQKALAMTLAKTPSGQGTLPDQVASKVMETTPVLMRFIRSTMKVETQTSVPQIRVMAFIEKHPGCSLTPLSEFLGITSASASTMIDRLVRGGLVDRLIDPLKRRNVVLHLTPIGQKELRGARQLAVEALSEQLSKLDDTQLKHVEESMSLLKAIFSTVDGDFDALTEHPLTTGETSSKWKRGPA